MRGTHHNLGNDQRSPKAISAHSLQLAISKRNVAQFDSFAAVGFVLYCVQCLLQFVAALFQDKLVISKLVPLCHDRSTPATLHSAFDTKSVMSSQNSFWGKHASVGRGFEDCETASAAWRALRALIATTCAANRHELEITFTGMSKKQSEAITDYVGRVLEVR